MKKFFLLTVIGSILFTACNNNSKSAFTGEIESNVAPVGTIPEQSIYNLTDTFTTDQNQTVRLSDFAGKPTVMVMIFTHCDYACPRLTADVKELEEKLGKNGDKVNFVLPSFDSERDFPKQLAKYKHDMKLDDNFTLLHGSDDAMRTLSVLLNVQYQKNQDGNFSHSNVISVLDASGNLIFQKEGIQANHEETMKKLNELLKG
ncbi:MAG: SCO family protein [Chitinophagaceae bacterium]|nr:SCO family protein [Chitinophagaceae bacterium]